MRPTRCRPPQEQAPSAAYALPPPQEPLPSRASLPALGLSGPPVPRTVPRRPRLRFRPLRLTGPGLHRGQAERPLPADCISQRALRRRAAPGRAEKPQSTLGNVVRNPTPPPPPPPHCGGGSPPLDSPASPGPGAAFWRRCSFRLGACVRGSVSGKSSRKASGLRLPSAVSPRPAGPPPTPTWPRSARDAASG